MKCSTSLAWYIYTPKTNPQNVIKMHSWVDIEMSLQEEVIPTLYSHASLFEFIYTYLYDVAKINIGIYKG